MKVLFSSAALLLLIAVMLKMDVISAINSVFEVETAMAVECKPNNNPPATPSHSLASVAQPVYVNVVNHKPSVGSAGDSGGPHSCPGSGMSIAWKGDLVSYRVSTSGASGMTAGCLNLGTSFDGQVAIGGEGGTLFEGNYNGNNPQFFDVSFITGYSVPMLCTGSGGASGCSIDLSSQGNSCPQPNGNMCTNPVGENGNKQPGTYAGNMAAEPWCYACSAPDPFFQPCSGAGYTYPYDDEATRTSTTTITCCIGTSCGSTGREGSTRGGKAETTRVPPCDYCEAK